MTSPDENDTNRKITGVTMEKMESQNTSNGRQQAVLSFRPRSFTCDEDELEQIYRTIVGNVLNGRDVIIVTKEDQLKDLISDAVEPADQTYVNENATKVISFVPKPESRIMHHATLAKKIPLSVAKDLASSTEFTYGNLWFLVPSNEADITQCGRDVITDICKLATFTFDDIPILHHETVASPAMYDGLKIHWFKPNENVYRKVISPLFENPIVI